MPQRDLLLPWLSALDNAALGIADRPGHPRAGRGERAAALFAELGLAGFEQARPHELSGGMRQRVAFVRTLLVGQAAAVPGRAVRRARRDHPRGDAGVAGGRAWQREPRTVVLVTHDVEEAIVLADRVAVLSPRPGRVVAELEVSPAPARAHRPGGGRAARARSDRTGARERTVRRRALDTPTGEGVRRPTAPARKGAR